MPEQKGVEANIEADFYKRIYDFISQRIARTEDAEEITQDVFLRLLKNQDQLADERIVPWVYKSARNAVIDFYRKSSRQPRIEQLPNDLANAESASSVLNPLAACLQPLVKKLSAEEQKLITEVELSDKTQQQYALENNLPYSTVKSKIQRSRIKLRKQLLRCCEMVLSSRGVPVEFDENQNCC